MCLLLPSRIASFNGAYFCIAFRSSWFGFGCWLVWCFVVFHRPSSSSSSFGVSSLCAVLLLSIYVHRHLCVRKLDNFVAGCFCASCFSFYDAAFISITFAFFPFFGFRALVFFSLPATSFGRFANSLVLSYHFNVCWFSGWFVSLYSGISSFIHVDGIVPHRMECCVLIWTVLVCLRAHTISTVSFTLNTSADRCDCFTIFVVNCCTVAVLLCCIAVFLLFRARVCVCRFGPNACVCVCVFAMRTTTHEPFSEAKLTFPPASMILQLQEYSHGEWANARNCAHANKKNSTRAAEPWMEATQLSSWSVSWPNSNNLQLVLVSLALSAALRMQQKKTKTECILIDSDADRHADMPQKLKHIDNIHTTTFFRSSVFFWSAAFSVCFAYKEFCNRFVEAISRERENRPLNSVS